MCGITGIFHYGEPDRPVDRDLLARMTRLLAHRGPDGEGFHVDGGLGLGHRRLSIVDLSPTGAQPMSNADGSCWISYNGEFYNHRVFRDRLAAKGHRFRGTSDSETMLHLLEEYGPDSLTETAGIFGFAFWESKRRRLTLARDPLGVKQVYYHDDGTRIVFASEIKALLACADVPRGMDPEGINQYLHFHTALFDRTCFRDIRQLRAGEYLQITPYGAKSKRYWKIDNFAPRGGEAEENVRLLRQQMSEVVGEQLMSDVPIGSFFSGGIDSTAVAAYAKRNGRDPKCYGVHFSNQGVIDERPFQEAAAQSLGLRLELTTVDGSAFPDELMRLMYHQDEPVIGAAMIPMYHVSRLASSEVKVCLGGQAADEIFGGYARYALTHPAQMMRLGSSMGGGSASGGRVGGNLFRQLRSRRVLARLVQNARNLLDWEKSYFENFANIPERSWRTILAGDGIFNREQCRQLFQEVTSRSEARDPADKVMHWDLQTYLTGLFHQDDRMSMAVSLESRVPLADPRMVLFAFHTGFDLKVRQGASKWILRKAVSDVLPEWVLNRRKVGFDTPAETWMKNQHAGFVRDLLLSSRARARGIWNARGIKDWLDNPNRQNWFNVIWKVLSLEVWAQIFLDGDDPVREAARAPQVVEVSSQPEPQTMAAGNRAVPAAEPRTSEAEPKTGFGDYVQFVREEGATRFMKRVVWEVGNRSGLKSATNRLLVRERRQEESAKTDVLGNAVQVFANPEGVAAAMADRIPKAALDRLQHAASEATRGRIWSFGRYIVDYGNPPDWHRNPANGARWPANQDWSNVLHAAGGVGDVKLTWEAARFPQAYILGRAASFEPEAAEIFADAFISQVTSFIEGNPPSKGIHWSSGQEGALRAVAWLFGMRALGHCLPISEQTCGRIEGFLAESVRHLQETLPYAENFVYNNHLIAEGLGVYLSSVLLPESGLRDRLVRRGKEILEKQADRQFYADGAYILQSHNYERGTLQLYLIASAVARQNGAAPAGSWIAAMERALDFLVAHENPLDGRLPNYGYNDGSMPCVLSCCEFSDFRPTLQALSLATRGERIFEPGAWDEEACWFLGPQVLEAPLRAPKRHSVSFSQSGYHVLRGQQEDSFAAFRCGSLVDQFSQMDMLHVDVWWRGLNVLVDGGSYRYNDAEKWHRHFLRSTSHNAVQVDGLDQMVQFTHFRLLYRTEAKLLRFEDSDEAGLCTGEHYAFRRHAGDIVHRRTLLFVKDDLWIVVDNILGTGSHAARLHWLGGDFPWRPNGQGNGITLDTPEGAFCVGIWAASGQRLDCDIVAGREDPPRGWNSRYYGDKSPAPSVVVNLAGVLPLTMVSILAGYALPAISVNGESWVVENSRQRVAFDLTSEGIAHLKLWSLEEVEA